MTETSTQRETGRFCTTADLVVYFSLNRQAFLAALDKNESIDDLYVQASAVAEKIQKLCSQRALDSLPFMKVFFDGDKSGWHSPYTIASFDGGSESYDHEGIELFEVAMIVDGGPFKKDHHHAFKNFVMSTVTEVCVESGTSFEYHSTCENRRLVVNTTQLIDLQ